MNRKIFNLFAMLRGLEGAAMFQFLGCARLHPDGWRFEASAIDKGASRRRTTPTKDLGKLKALGFFGVVALDIIIRCTIS